MGSVLPALPGPPISYGGLLLLHFFTPYGVGTNWIIVYSIVTVLIVVVDYMIPIWGAKKYGGTSWGIYGSIAGMLTGMILFPPLGMIVGAALGALVGELLAGKRGAQAIRAAQGSLMGILAGTLLKVGFCAIMLVHATVLLI